MDFNNMPSFGGDNNDEWNTGFSDSGNEFGFGFGNEPQYGNKRATKSNGFADFISEYYIDIICCALLCAFLVAVIFNWQFVMDVLFIYILFPIMKFLSGVLLTAIIIVIILVVLFALFGRLWK